MPWAFPEYLQQAGQLKEDYFQRKKLSNLRESKFLDYFSFNSRGRGMEKKEIKDLEDSLLPFIDGEGHITKQGAKILVERLNALFCDQKELKERQIHDYWSFVSSELAKLYP